MPFLWLLQQPQITVPSKGTTEPPSFRRSLRWCALGMFGIAVFTAVALRLHLSFASASFCYLLILVVQSLAGDFASSVMVAFLAVGCLDFFFVEPLFSFQVESPVDTLGLATFLITGVVITKLVTQVRKGAEQYRRQHETLAQFYELAQQLLASEPNPACLFEPFRGVFGLTGICLFDAASAEVHIAGTVGEELERQTGETYIHGRQFDNYERGVTVRCIRIGGRTIGAIGFEGLENPELTAGPLTALTAAHLERAHSFANASQAATAAQTESYRSAILDALAHEFKTPLSTIMTAAGALREGPTLAPEEREMAETVESEAARLGRLTSRLIRTARLEREEIRPWIELIDVSAVIKDSVEQYSRLSSGRRNIHVVNECCSNEVMADPELLRLAVSQLLDNACKYSDPQSPVTLTLVPESGQIALRVVSSGNPIPANERHKIFERFYRGVDGRRSGPGSGLGLFVARKIAVALGGSLELESGPAPVDTTVFRLALPVPQGKPHDIAAAV
jgi:two-component system sensor histidine kinase KdpD